MQCDHIHLPTIGLETNVPLRRDAKEAVLKDVFQPTGVVLDDVLLAYKDAPGSHFQNYENVKKACNRRKAKGLPKEPKEDEKLFSIQTDFFAPEFFQGAVIMPNKSDRHLIFASEEQLKYLAKTNRWYLDGTFKIVRRPFVQLFTINGFLENDKGTILFSSSFSLHSSLNDNVM